MLFMLRIPTRSPFCSPRPIKAFASLRTPESSSAKVIRRPVVESTMASLSGVWCAHFAGIKPTFMAAILDDFGLQEVEVRCRVPLKPGRDL